MSGCRSLTVEEIRRVIEALSSKRDKALFITGIKTGFRITELLSLTPKSIREDGTIYVVKQNMKGKLRGRAVPLHPDARAQLIEYINESKCQVDSKLFPLSRFQAHRILKDAYNAIGITGKVATHSMRKTFATNVYNRLDKDILKTGKALGHVTGFAYKNTEQYLEVNQDEINKAILD